MKILFLDHDGVICLVDNWGGRYNKQKEGKTGIDAKFDDFYPDAIDILNEIIDATDCEIVISSDWRLYCTLEEMQELYKTRGVRKVPIAYTPHAPKININLAALYSWKGRADQARILEISTYRDENIYITNWCVVDDIDMRNELKGNFVWCNSPDGLLKRSVKERIIKVLNHEQK